LHEGGFGDWVFAEDIEEAALLTKVHDNYWIYVFGANATEKAA
jgi:hypothetical protein